MDLDVGALSDQALVDELTSWAARAAAGDALVLRLLGELDAREAWGAVGVLSCAHWAAWRLGLSLPTARERVRVARCLRTLPLLEAELAAGRVSYAQVRAVTRVATPQDEQQWVELALVTSAAQLEKATRGVGRARGDRQHRRDARIRWDEDGTLVLTLRVAAGKAPGVLAAIESAQRQEQTDRDELYARLATEVAGGGSVAVSAETSVPGAPPYAAPYAFVEPPYPLFAARGLFEPQPPEQVEAMRRFWDELHRRQALADAARAWADHVEAVARDAEIPRPRASLTDGVIRALTRPQGLPPVTVRLLVDPVSGWARTAGDELLPPLMLQRVLGQTHLSSRPLAPRDLTRHDRGRDTRLVTPALRSLLGQLDGERCRFPSCTRTRNLHAHHVRFWRAGGRTDLSNLALVCSRHHTLIHEQGFRLTLTPDRVLTVRTAADVPVPSRPASPRSSPRELALAPPLAPTLTGDRFDLGYVVMVMSQRAA